MAVFPHPGTGIPMGDPDRVPLNGDNRLPTREEVDRFVSTLILSASGWRSVFAFDGDQESRTPHILPVAEFIAAVAASTFADFIKNECGKDSPTIIAAIDTRPTGPAIADVMVRAFLAAGCRVRYLFVSAAPEVMAYARAAGASVAAAVDDEAADSMTAGHELDGPPAGDGLVDGFAYISASHNPIGHNGLKFGFTDGGVIGADRAAVLIAEFRARIAAPDAIQRAAELLARVDAKRVSRLFAESGRWKRAAVSAYTLFSREVVTGSADPAVQERTFDRIARAVAERPLSVIADLNGSARTVTIDADALTGLGIRVDAINARPGGIAHRIVPEGESLEPCRLRLEELHATDSSFTLGYLPDCDGDRGNLVVWDQTLQAARALDAQEVFALCCVAELAHLVWTGGLRYDTKGNALEKVAVAINDPTSMRVDRIAAAFDVDVFRAEVGEANVVTLARKLRDRGFTVRILGEGAAGGNITHPSAVRDPLATLFALIKLLTIRSDENGSGLFELWCDLSKQHEAYRPDFGFSDIVATLPAFVTTGAYEENAVLRVANADHAALKDRYQQVFLDEWERKKLELSARFGIVSWEAIGYNGTEEKRGLRNFGEVGKGGLKILFRDAYDHPKAYIWMRGSGTEPVFRVMADVAGPDRRMERELLAWQRSMVERADRPLGA